MDRKFWQERYDTKDTRFDLGGPTPVLVDWLDTAKPLPAQAIVPGCGRGYDVLELARRGWDALGVDFAPTAIADARKAAAGLENARFAEADLFALGPEHDAAYALWWENTCYCAIPPDRRNAYAAVAARLVKPGGVLVFDVFPVDGRAGGPPFAIDPAEVGPRFSPHFTLESLAPPPRASAAPRAGKELLAVLRRR